MKNSVIKWLRENLSPKEKVKIKSMFDKILSLDSHRSYSQFGEDSFLYSYYKGKAWTPNRKTIGFGVDIEKGFYVDVGCYSPMDCSNTYLFYRQGWRGINIDPTPGVKEMFDAVRPRDINLQLAVSESATKIDLFSWGNPNVFNTVSPVVAETRCHELGRDPTVIQVQAKPLKSILNTFLPAGQAISFLNIDVEGYDLVVLTTNDWEKYRPEIVIVEDYQADMESILDSDIYRFLGEVEYQMIAWLNPSTIYVDTQSRVTKGIK